MYFAGKLVYLIILASNQLAVRVKMSIDAEVLQLHVSIDLKLIM